MRLEPRGWRRDDDRMALAVAHIRAALVDNDSSPDNFRLSYTDYRRATADPETNAAIDTFMSAMQLDMKGFF